MDCADCTRHVQSALAALPGVQNVEVLLSSEQAIVQLDPAQVTLPALRAAVASAGYSVPEELAPAQTALQSANDANGRALGILLVALCALVILVVIAGEWLGLFERVNELLPLPAGAALVLLAAFPILRNVVRAALRRQIISHTLMSLGVLAALLVGQWVTALVVVGFMYMGDYVEKSTTHRARGALRQLTALSPQTAHLERAGELVDVPIAAVQPGDIVLVRPGEKIPVDGEVVSGQATINQAAITGEPMPIEAGPGSRVLAATIAQLGSLRVRTTHAGPDTTFGQVIQLVEQAEAHRADVGRFADRFSAYYLPIVLAFAAVTFLVRRDPLATAAVLVVACSCSIALATPIAMLASIGAAARRGILVKGSKYLETLARADVLFLDKTGTLTLGRPAVTDIVPLDGLAADDLLSLAASLEQHSEHPLAESVRAAARARNLALAPADAFEALPGLGVRGRVADRTLTIGSARLLPSAADWPQAQALAAQGKTLLFVTADDVPLGILAASDTLRPEVPAALAALRALGLRHIELLTGDDERAASTLAGGLGLDYRANLLPSDKIELVKAFQAQGHRVVMVGDGVNDAPALAQADVGIAMGAAGSDIAIQAAHIALLRDDWTLVPAAFQIARRTMGVVKMNLGLTALYNLLGLSLAALGILPPILAAGAQSLPDLGILANSSRLLRQK